MYESYWNLTEKPFENTPNTRFLFYSKEHEEALSRFMYAVKERKGLAMFTGEYGSGKTLISMVVLKDLKNNKDFHVALIVNPRLSLIEFLREIIFQLQGELPQQKEKLELLHILRNILSRNSAFNRETVIIIDESQMIKDLEIFEDLRLLSNLQYEDKFLVTLIFIGQPQLKEIMSRLPQLKQRLAITHHLQALNESETKSYIEHRLRVAGAARTIFTDKAIQLVYLASGGVPRKINTTCDICLVIGRGERAGVIDENITNGVVKNILEENAAR
ncbi:MAG: AAA family ATPase [Candidatus Omnitrophota bacterium]